MARNAKAGRGRNGPNGAVLGFEGKLWEAAGQAPQNNEPRGEAHPQPPRQVLLAEAQLLPNGFHQGSVFSLFPSHRFSLWDGSRDFPHVISREGSRQVLARTVWPGPYWPGQERIAGKGP